MSLKAWANEFLEPLTPSKLDDYFKHVSSGTITQSMVRACLSKPSGRYDVLKTLIRLHTSNFPWGSLTNHYTTKAINSLKPEDVFEKFVTRGLGGHCLEFVTLFGGVLRALDYDFYLTGVRLGNGIRGNMTYAWHGWSHVIFIVTMEGKQYACDCQYLYITEPVPLDPTAAPFVFQSVPNAVVRARHVALSEIVPNKASNSGLKTWLFEYKYDVADPEWMSLYIFDTQTEWFLEDLQIMNVWLAAAAQSYLTSSFVIKRLLLKQQLDGKWEPCTRQLGTNMETGAVKPPEIAGVVQIVENRLIVWVNGEKKTQKLLNDEVERLEAMDKWFGVKLTTEEKESILSRPAKLPLQVKELEATESIFSDRP